MNIYMNLRKIIKRYRGIENYSLDYETVKRIINEEKNAVLIDVRSRQEYREGHLDGSINISLYDFERGNYKIENKDSIIILYCGLGKRSKRAMQILKKAGYTKVYQIEGGIEGI